jgi:hypothetical protein
MVDGPVKRRTFMQIGYNPAVISVQDLQKGCGSGSNGMQFLIAALKVPVGAFIKRKFRPEVIHSRWLWLFRNTYLKILLKFKTQTFRSKFLLCYHLRDSTLFNLWLD